MSKIRTIQFRLNLTGRGVVNFDSKDQKWIHINNTTGLNGSINDNVNYAKKNFYKKLNKDGEEILDYKLKISSDCLKKNIFSEDIIATNPNMMHVENILYNYISSPVALLKGWLFAKKEETLHRKHALNLTSAEQICNAKSKMEVFARAEVKESKHKIDDTSSNTFFYLEDLDKIKYQAEGAIDIAALQLITADQLLDRYSFNPDNFELFKEFFNVHFGSNDIKLAYYKLKSSVINLNEYAVYLKDEYIKQIINMLFNRLFALDIRKRNAFAACEKIQIRLVDDPTVQTISNEDGWITINNISEIRNILDNIDFYQFYEEINEKEAIDNRIMCEETMKEMVKKVNADKELKKEQINIAKELKKVPVKTQIS